MRLRFFKYKCPKNEDGCLFSWDGDISNRSICIYCNISSQEMDTVWDGIRSFYWRTIPYEYRPNILWYKFTCWAWFRYTTIKPRKLGHTFCDKKELLHHVIFEVLCEFVENEIKPKTMTKNDWEWQKENNPAFYKAWKEAVSIYNWWVKQPIYGIEFNEDYTWQKEDAYFNNVRKKAKRVVDISPYFWT